MTQSRRSATVSRPVSIEGRGLFSGQACHAVVVPRYNRSGLTYFNDEGDRIEAVTTNFLEQPNCTVITQDGASIAVTEHLQAALWAAGIDSAEIHVEGPEIPNRDGSAINFYQAIISAGREELDFTRPVLEIASRLQVRDDNAMITLEPADNSSIRYEFSHPELGEQQFEWTIDRTAAAAELLPARTFITMKEVELARQAGFLQNENAGDALLIEDGKPNSPLRFANEFARHKVLDLIGDTALLPFDWNARITAIRSGHRLNRELARRLMELYEQGL